MHGPANGRPARFVLAAALSLSAAACGSSPTQPPPPSPTPAPVVTVPTLLVPAGGGALSNDCTGDTWAFDWSDVPNASMYGVQVRREGASGLVVDAAGVVGSEYRWRRDPSIVPEAERRGWRWRVRAMVDGAWRDWSPESAFEVDPLFPRQLAPAAGAVLDNGCTSGRDPMTWAFHWSACASATRYHLSVFHAGAPLTAISDDRILGPDYESTLNAYVADPNRRDWRWQVRARFADGWGQWSAEQSFDVEPLDTDCR